MSNPFPEHFGDDDEAYRRYRRDLRSTSSLSLDLGVNIDAASWKALLQEFRDFPEAAHLAALETVGHMGKRVRKVFAEMLDLRIRLRKKIIRKGIGGGRPKRTGDGAFSTISLGANVYWYNIADYHFTPASPPRLKGVPIRDRVRTRYQLRRAGPTYDDTNMQDTEGSRYFVQRANGQVAVWFRKKASSHLHWAHAPGVAYYATRLVEGEDWQIVKPVLESDMQAVFEMTLRSLTGLGVS